MSSRPLYGVYISQYIFWENRYWNQRQRNTMTVATMPFLGLECFQHLRKMGFSAQFGEALWEQPSIYLIMIHLASKRLFGTVGNAILPGRNYIFSPLKSNRISGFRRNICLKFESIADEDCMHCAPSLDKIFHFFSTISKKLLFQLCLFCETSFADKCIGKMHIQFTVQLCERF